MKQVEFLFDFGSPTTYIAYRVLPRIAAAGAAEVLWRPILLGGIFRATGNASPVMVPAKGRWMLKDLARWAQKYEIPFVPNPHFPINTLLLMRGAMGYLGTPNFHRYLEIVFEALWVEQQNLNDEEVVGSVLSAGGLDPQEFLGLVGNPDIKARLKADTEAAVERGVFGAPTFFVDSNMYFGQDRLQFVAEALGVNITEVVPRFLEPTD